MHEDFLFARVVRMIAFFANAYAEKSFLITGSLEENVFSPWYGEII